MLIEKLRSDLILAFKSKSETKRATLKLVLAEAKNREIELRGKGQELTNEEIIGVIQKEVKKRQEAAEIYEQAGRAELAAKERAEEEVLRAYLPEPISPDELAKIIQAAINGVGAKTPADLGKVMAVLMPQVKGRVDGGEVNQLVKQALGVK